jgi:hypothetical protein
LHKYVRSARSSLKSQISLDKRKIFRQRVVYISAHRGDTIPTFQTILENTNGLYREIVSDRGYLREDLLAALPGDLLASEVQLRKVEHGVYSINTTDTGEQLYALFSRRRRPREEV